MVHRFEKSESIFQKPSQSAMIKKTMTYLCMNWKDLLRNNLCIFFLFQMNKELK